MPIPKTASGSGLVIWPSTNASIPANWTRDTDFDGIFLQGTASGTNPGTTGGRTSYAPTATAHSHTENSHVHVLSITDFSDTTNNINSGTATRAGIDHTHVDANSASTVGTNQNTTITVNSATVQPTFTRVIFIKPSDASQDVPVGSVIYSDQSTVVSGFAVSDGTGGTTLNLNSKFLLGATTGGDSGGTGGASTHTFTAVDHTHTSNSHTHANSDFGATSGTVTNASSSGLAVNAMPSVHHRAISISSTTPTTQNASVTVDAQSSEPAYYQLLAIQNVGASASTPNYTIVPFTGPLSEIPTSSYWFQCDGTGATPNLLSRQVKVTTSAGSIGTTGGQNSLTYTTQAHTHTQNSHTHTFTFSNSGSTTALTTSPAVTIANITHAHGGSQAMASAVATLQNATVVLSTEDIRYSYKEVCFIQLRLPTVHIKGAKILGNTLIK